MAVPRFGSPAYRSLWANLQDQVYGPGSSTAPVPAHLRPRRRRAPMPPAGSYDPALDAQGAAAQRGLLDVEQDIRTQNTRDTVDYGLQRGDILQSRDRGVQDLTIQRDRGKEDYDRNVGLLRQSFQRLGNSQSQQQRAYGVSRGGAALQAARKRAANEAQEKSVMDTAFQRLNEDIYKAGTRLHQDTDTGLGRLALMMGPPDASSPFGGRSFQDRTTQLTRAQREGAAFGLDLDAQRGYQAAAAGWSPPKKRRRRR